jgi:processive 1,2-diacylglycerol beta-glucosyltransferase
MIKLYDNETGSPLGEISEGQLAFLVDQLEEESGSDKDYYLNRATLDMFERNGADRALMEMLRKAMGEREEMEIRWSREG